MATDVQLRILSFATSTSDKQCESKQRTGAAAIEGQRLKQRAGKELDMSFQGHCPPVIHWGAPDCHLGSSWQCLSLSDDQELQHLPLDIVDQRYPQMMSHTSNLVQTCLNYNDIRTANGPLNSFFSLIDSRSAWGRNVTSRPS